MIVPLEKSWGEKTHVAVTQIIANDCAGQAMPRRVEKTWGYELHYRNDERYCMKLLHFNGPVDPADKWQWKQEGSWLETKFDDPSISTSMHFHVLKHETLLVVHGTLTLEIIIDKKTIIHKLPQGTAWVICPGHVHRLSAIEGSLEIVEASTTDYPDDSVRIN